MGQLGGQRLPLGQQPGPLLPEPAPLGSICENTEHRRVRTQGRPVLDCALCTDRREASWTPVLGVTEREVRQASGPGGYGKERESEQAG